MENNQPLAPFEKLRRLSFFAWFLITAFLISACSLNPASSGDCIIPPETLGQPDINKGFNSIAGAVIYEDKQPPYVLYDGGPKVSLNNNPAASNPSWDQLVSFIKSDYTDRSEYSDSYMCGGFAQTLHDNAESNGIRAGWVAIDFFDRDIGHAATAFQTTDRGLVVIDATSSYNTEGYKLSSATLNGYDKVAYIKIGADYGVISLEVANSPFYNEYQLYLNNLEDFETLGQDYERQVNEYNQAVNSGSYSYGYLNSWYHRLEDMKQQLDDLAAELGGYYWESLGMVSAVTIFW